ncbi:hypothetical protein ACAG96_04315 [Candidatus Izemoplasma sp. B36]|uniref:hypothetical protein n=1 Tax=Candidatus Izemoplasma sp. B36 TaxID=3242468 RepID=UPI003558F587
MFILEFLLTLIYIILIISFVLLVIALALPLAILYGVYWLLFLSWNPEKRKKVKVIKKSKVSTKDITDLVSKSIKLGHNTENKAEAKKEINELAKKIKESAIGEKE